LHDIIIMQEDLQYVFLEIEEVELYISMYSDSYRKRYLLLHTHQLMLVGRLLYVDYSFKRIVG